MAVLTSVEGDRQAIGVRVEAIVPLAGRVLVRWAQKDETTKGGVVLPQQSRTISQTGTVLAIASDVDTVAVGDVILFASYAASPCVAVSGEESDLLFLRDRDILAVVNT